MAGTSEGAKTMKQKFGSDFFQIIGRDGGRAKNPKKGFGSNPARASLAGKKGGLTRVINMGGANDTATN